MKIYDKVREIYIEDEGYCNDLYIYEIKEDRVLLKQYDEDEGFWVDKDEVEVMPDIRELAEFYDKDVIETTTGTNGYPQNIKPAMIGFETFEEAQEIANEHGLSVESFEKRDGWQLWVRRNNTRFNAYQNSAEDFGDNYMEFCKMDEDDFFEQEVNWRLEEGFESFEALGEFLKVKKEVWDEIEKMEEDEIVITNEGYYFGTIKQESMRFYHDTKHYVIGLIDNN